MFASLFWLFVMSSLTTNALAGSKSGVAPLRLNAPLTIWGAGACCVAEGIEPPPPPPGMSTANIFLTLAKPPAMIAAPVTNPATPPCATLC